MKKFFIVFILIALLASCNNNDEFIEQTESFQVRTAANSYNDEGTGSAPYISVSDRSSSNYYGWHVEWRSSSSHEYPFYEFQYSYDSYNWFNIQDGAFRSRGMMPPNEYGYQIIMKPNRLMLHVDIKSVKIRMRARKDIEPVTALKLTQDPSCATKWSNVVEMPYTCGYGGQIDSDDNKTVIWLGLNAEESTHISLVKIYAGSKQIYSGNSISTYQSVREYELDSYVSDLTIECYEMPNTSFQRIFRYNVSMSDLQRYKYPVLITLTGNLNSSTRGFTLKRYEEWYKQ